MAPKVAAHLGHLVGPGVERDHRGAAAGRLEGVAAEAAAEVEQAVAGADAEPVVVDGQHRRHSRATVAAAGRAGQRPALEQAS